MGQAISGFIFLGKDSKRMRAMVTMEIQIKVPCMERGRGSQKQRQYAGHV